MITLLLLAQITRDEFLDFIKQAEIQFARIDERFNRIEKEIQALNQRIDDLRKDNENIRNDIRNQMIFFGTLFVGILGVLITFLISKQTENWLLNLKKNLRIWKMRIRN